MARLAPAQQEIVVLAVLPEPGEMLGTHLVVAVHLEHPRAARLAVAAEDRGAVSAVRLPRDDEPREILGQPLEDRARPVAGAVVVQAELVVDVEPVERGPPGPPRPPRRRPPPLPPPSPRT